MATSNKRKSKVLVEQFSAEWRVSTIGLLAEVLQNPGTGILHKPINIFKNILAEVAERCIEINDPELNALMCRLALYEQADPYSKEYHKEYVNKVIDEGLRIKIEKRKAHQALIITSTKNK